MNQFPVTPLSPEEQQRVMRQMYVLMGKQVESYHKHRHMGSNTSVPVELAQELMESVEYTLQFAGGIYAGTNMEESLKIGQVVLNGKQQKAKAKIRQNLLGRYKFPQKPFRNQARKKHKAPQEENLRQQNPKENQKQKP